MLFYKGWLESRTRFVTCFLVLAALCAYSVIHGPAVLAHSARPVAYSKYIYFEIYSSITTFVFNLCVMLLALGGLLREKAQGTAAVSLTLPASRARLVITRAVVGLAEVGLLALIPVLTIGMLSPLVREYYPVVQTVKFAVLWIFVGAAYFSFSFLGSTVLSGEYTAAGACILGLFAYSFLFGRVSALHPFNLNGVITGRVSQSLDRNTALLSDPLHWGYPLALACVTVAVIALSVLVSCRRDY